MTAPPTRRWVIPDRPDRDGDSKEYWESAHAESGYEEVFSVGEDDGVRDAIATAALEGAPRRILLAGCGSRTELQQELLERAAAGTTLVATDFERVVALARERFSHPDLTYVALESEPGFRECFDTVVSANVLISDSDLANRELVAEWAAALAPGGRLVALVPILFAGQELALLSGSAEIAECIDVEGSAWVEKHQGIRQIEYSPLRLRRVLREAGLRLVDLRIVFLESPSSRRQSELHYGLDDEDLLVYEQLVVAERER